MDQYPWSNSIYIQTGHQKFYLRLLSRDIQFTEKEHAQKHLDQLNKALKDLDE